MLDSDWSKTSSARLSTSPRPTHSKRFTGRTRQKSRILVWGGAHASIKRLILEKHWWLHLKRQFANLLASTYEELFSCASNGENEMSVLMTVIDNDFVRDNVSCKDSIANEIRDAVDKHEHGKGDGYLGLSSDHCIDWYMYNSQFSIPPSYSHLYAARWYVIFSAIIPIPKLNKRQETILGELLRYHIKLCFMPNFDLIPLKGFSDRLFVLISDSDSDPMDVRMCTSILTETVSYRISSDSQIYCILKDATKTFDRFNIIISNYSENWRSV